MAISEFRAGIWDRMEECFVAKTNWYDTYKDAHDSAERLCKNKYSGERYEIKELDSGKIYRIPVKKSKIVLQQYHVI